MEKYLANSDGEIHYEMVKKNIPSPYCNYVEDIMYVRGERVYERILKRILEMTLPGSKIDKPSALFPRERGKIHGGYLKPDLRVNDNVFIEVTTWGDSNMIFSKIMQGYLLKKKFPKARYYVVIADLDIDGWTWNEDKGLWVKWSEIEDKIAVDGWFGFKNIDKLVNII